MIRTTEELTNEERERLMRREKANAEGRLSWRDGSTPQEQAAMIERFRKAQKWVHDHKEQYDGQFVCLYGDRLISYGTDGKAVYREAKEKGIKTPFITRVKAKELPFGGW